MDEENGAGRKKRLTLFRAVIVTAFLVYSPVYLAWRVSVFNTSAPVFSITLWAAEVFGFLTAAMHVFMVSRLTRPESPPVPGGLTVDVYVPTFNEDVSILRHTLIAARDMEYPHTTWLLDDGNRQEMRALAEELGCRYLSRKKNIGAKAGNLNNAMRHSSGEFIALFDADHVPNRKFLVRTLGFFADSEVAFVQTPQDFYNLDSYQHRRKPGTNFIWTEQSLFFRVIQRGKDFWNAAFLCGSCAVLRRSSLEAIGGFAEDTITEDLHTSLKLHKAGYRSVYVGESLAFGLAPSTTDSFLLQRLRWGRGAMQVWRKEGILFARGLTFPQRINYLASVLTYFDGWQKAIFYSAPVIVLVTGVMPIAALNLTFLAYFIPYYLLSFWVFEELSRGFGRPILTEQYNMARFYTFIKATIPVFRKQRFSVTPKGQSEHGSSSWRTPEMVVLITSLAGILVGLVLWSVREGHLPLNALVANIFWGSMNLGMAGAIYRFTSKRKQRRKEYRFQLPVAGWVYGVDRQKIVGVISNISASGCSLITEHPLEQTKVNGSLVLPGGQINFQADVRSVIQIGEKKEQGTREPRNKYANGLEFHWDDIADETKLENYLFGTNLQWEVLGLRESVRTPASLLLSWIEDGRYPRLPRITGMEWLPFVYKSSDTDEGVSLGVLLRESGQIKRAIFFQWIKEGSKVQANIFNHKESLPASIKLGRVTEISSSNLPVYTCDAIPFTRGEQDG